MVSVLVGLAGAGELGGNTAAWSTTVGLNIADVTSGLVWLGGAVTGAGAGGVTVLATGLLAEMTAGVSTTGAVAGVVETGAAAVAATTGVVADAVTVA